MKQNHHSSGLALGLALGLLGACSTLAPVDYKFNPDVHWAQQKAFAWAPMKTPEIADERVDATVLDGRIRAAVEADLAVKGLHKVASDAADFLVGYTVGLEDRTYHGDALPRRWGDGPFELSYEVGTLQILLIDPDSKNTMWSGTYQSEIGTSTPGKHVARAVSWVLEGFPP